MISEAIIESGRFLKLSDKAKTLYMYLMVRTDDEGAVEAYPAMMLIGAGEDELEELISKGFVIRLNDDDVVYVTDFSAQNILRSDRVKPSRFHDLIAVSCPQIAGNCQQNAAECPPNTSQSNLAEGKLKEDKLTEGNLNQVSPETDLEDGPVFETKLTVFDPLEEYQIPYIHEHMLARYRFTEDDTRLLVRLASKLQTTGIYCDEEDDEVDCLWLRNYFSAKCDHLNYWMKKKDIKNPFLYMKEMVEEDLRAEGTLPERNVDTKEAV
jgi:hypothetical protein